MPRQFTKYADETITKGIDWTNVLSNANNGSADTIATATWTIEPSGLTNVADSVIGSNTQAIIQVSGGTVDTIYTLWCKITLNTGSDTPIDYIKIRVVDDNTT